MKDVNAKENFLSLYNAIHNTKLKLSEVTIESEIIDQALYNTYYNDVSVIINGKLIVLVEHQSTINENMPLRFLDYVVRIYEKNVKQENRYKRKLVQIPTPEFYVFYNGTQPIEDQKIYRLSEQFEKREDIPDLELIVTVININEGHNPELMAACKTLKSYSIFVALVRKYIKEINPNAEDKDEAVRLAIERAIEECILQNILKEFFSVHRQEVVYMSMWDYNEELHNKTIAKENYDDGFNDGFNDGIKNGLSGGIKNTTRLFSWLFDQGRDEDVKRASVDEEYLDEMFKEYDSKQIKVRQNK